MQRVRSLEVQAVNVLDQFSAQIGWVVDSVMRSFDLEPHFRDDLRQEASTLVLSYASLLETPIWGDGRLFRWVTKAEGDEEQVRALLARQLRIDLSQTVKRQVDRTDGYSMADSLDELVEEGLEPVDETWEDTQIDLADAGGDTRIHERYPSLALNMLDGFTQDQIAEAVGVTDRAIRKRITKEKRLFLIDYVTRKGLRVEGDETLADLAEAYGYLKAAGR